MQIYVVTEQDCLHLPDPNIWFHFIRGDLTQDLRLARMWLIPTLINATQVKTAALWTAKKNKILFLIFHDAISGSFHTSLSQVSTISESVASLPAFYLPDAYTLKRREGWGGFQRPTRNISRPAHLLPRLREGGRKREKICESRTAAVFRGFRRVTITFIRARWEL